MGRAKENENNLPWEQPGAAKKLKKSNNFFTKLKEKINKLFDNDNYTIIGKLLILSIWTVAASVVFIIPIDIIRGIFKAACGVEVFPTLNSFCITLFVVSLAYIVITSVIEIFAIGVSDGDGSIFLKETDN